MTTATETPMCSLCAHGSHTCIDLDCLCWRSLGFPPAPERRRKSCPSCGAPLTWREEHTQGSCSACYGADQPALPFERGPA